MEMRTRHMTIPKPIHHTANYPTRLPLNLLAWQKSNFGSYPSVREQEAQSEITASAFMWKCEKNGPGRMKRIYTDWANYYLEKAKCKRQIQDLQVDVTDGVILSDVVEAVTNQKIPDVVRKPKNSSQMLDNIQYCLVYLSGLGVALEGISARDIREGHLKSILSLFFQLSRYKQQQKQQDRDRHNLLKQTAEMQPAIKSLSSKHSQESSKLPSPFGKHSGGNTSIPVPTANGSTPKKTSGDKGKPAIPSHSYSPCGPVKPSSGGSSRSTSPSTAGGPPQSFIPTPRSSIPSAPSSARSSIHEKNFNNAKNSSGPSSKSSVRIQNNNSVNSNHSPPTNNGNGNGKNSSMLEKFKFFKEKDKGEKQISSGNSKRTSSSSGFSSARSERSDSSISLYAESKGGSFEETKESANGSIQQSSSQVDTNSGGGKSQTLTSTPKLGIKGFRQKIGKAIGGRESKGNHHSPKSSRKDESFGNSEIGNSKASQESLRSQQSTSNGTRDQAECKKVGKTHLKIEPKGRAPQPPDISQITPNSGTNGTNGGSTGPSFLRHPKSGNLNSGKEKNRYSGTGIPTRNSFIAPPANLIMNGQSPQLKNEVHGLSTTPSGSNNQLHSDIVANNFNSSLSSMNGVVGNGTGIPKPTAAVKGTTKSMTPPAAIIPTKDVEKSSAPQGANIKDCSNLAKIASTNKIQLNIMKNGEVTNKSPHDPLGKNEGITVALVSPMPTPPLPTSETSSVITSASVSSVESALSLSQSISEMSVISVKKKEEEPRSFSPPERGGKVEFCEAVSSPRPINGVIAECDEDEIMLNVTPMEPILRSSPYGYIKSPPGTTGFLTSQKPPVANGVQMSLMENNCFGKEGELRPIDRNRSALNPYSDSLLLTSKQQFSNKLLGRNFSSSMSDHDYSEIDNYDLGSGYLSDGDLLSTGKNGRRFNDGYVSESGAYIYKRAPLNGRSKGSHGQNGGKVSNHALIAEDSFDDSSSISSGNSDLNEIPTDLTSSSVNSELSSPYASLQRSNGPKNTADSQNIIYRVVGCRVGNKKKPDSANHKPEEGPGGSNALRLHDKKECNGYFVTAPGRDSGPGEDPNKSHRALVVVREKKESGSGGSSQLNYCLNPGIQSEGLSHHSSPHSSTKRSDGKSMNNLESKKRSPMGMKEESYGREMYERMSREQEYGKGRPHGREHSSLSHGSSGSSGGSCDGKSRSGKGSATGGYGYVRRSSGDDGAKTALKYGSVSLSRQVRGERDILTEEEYKAVHVALMSAKAGEPNPYAVGIQGSPKPRTKVKVSGGTQTTNDLHEMSRGHSQQLTKSCADPEYASSTCSRNSTGSLSSQPGYKSLSLTTPTATQLSQSLRERILGSQSLPKAATSSADYAAILASIQQQQGYGTPKERMSRYHHKPGNDETMSEAGGYANYAQPQVGSPYSWMRHSAGYASSITSAPTRLITGSMTEAESMESLSSSASLATRSCSLVQGRGKESNHHHHQPRETSPSRSPRLNRSNSISHFRERTFPRSTKSEKLYPSMLQRTDDVSPYYSSTISGGINNMPSSPLHNASNRMSGGQGAYSSTPASSHSVRLSMAPYSGFLAKIATKEDEMNGSSLSLVSTASSIYSSQEEKQAYELRKLKRELHEAQDKVQTLSSQLSTNAHVVAAFEQSLSNMTQRLQSLNHSAEQKDSELVELRHTIELLRKQSIEAGLSVANLNPGLGRDGSPMARQLSADSVSSINSISSACSGTSHSHNSSPSGQIQMTPSGTPTHHGNHCAPDSPNSKKKNAKNKGWLRSSFSKAFSRSKSKPRNGSTSDADVDEFLRRPSNLNGDMSSQNHHQFLGVTHHGMKHLETSAPASPLLTSPHGLSTHGSNGCSSSNSSHSPHSNGIAKTSSSSSAVGDDFEESKSIEELRKQLREKEMVLTDIRLEALTSAHQLESLKETVTKMRNEMDSLKQDNERLQRMLPSKSLTSSQNSLQMNESFDRRLSNSELPVTLDSFITDSVSKEGKRFVVTVLLGSHGVYERYFNNFESQISECSIGTVSVSNKTKWELLDSLIKRCFKDYVMRIDPVSNLGLSSDSILCYNVGEINRGDESKAPELLPCGYLVGDVNKIRICLKGAANKGNLDGLAFETLIPKAILQRYVTLLADHGRMILCGPSGTGKSYLARKLGEFLVARSGKNLQMDSIDTFTADQKNTKELRQYLTNLGEQCESGNGDLPSVIILDNLHQVNSFGDMFNGFLQLSQVSTPYIIGTMTQASGISPTLQHHHNFRWVLVGNHLEPVKGLLNRYLQRRLVEADIQAGLKDLELSRVLEWIPKVWAHVNKFLETHNSVEVTIGPRLFLSCPTDIINSQVWFTDLWHYSLVPYIIEAMKEGLQLYGKKAPWEDPSAFLLQTYPWTEAHSANSGKSALLRLRPEDVGYDINNDSNGHNGNPTKDSSDPDPLMNMLMRLQEAANYSGPTSNDSGSTSLESNGSHFSKDYTATA